MISMYINTYGLKAYGQVRHKIQKQIHTLS